jgi:UDP-N-acetylmuramate: L-alanyl-gamma-D-glutamyl-meso-diaminopimelate ligase
MRIHVVGVAGTGMGALAGLLGELGHEVAGSDTAFDPPMGPALLAWGVRCLEGFAPAHLDPAPDLVVIGNVCRPTNVEASAAFERALDITHIAGALARFVLPGTSPLVVAGTHGKTTTSALVAFLLDRAGYAPGFLIGGLPQDFPHSFRRPRRPGEGARPGAPERRAPPFVIEGDEYDTAFFEKTAKFLHYQAEVAIVTSIEHDHIDIYPTFEAYRHAFHEFVRRIPDNGLLVANAADREVVSVVREAARAPVVWFALEDEPDSERADYLASQVTQDGQGTSFDLLVRGIPGGRYRLGIPGRHNTKNALAALASVSEGYGVPPAALGSALGSFRGVRRRQELLGEPGGVRVYDDFAHHPTAVRETLAALRARHPEGMLLAVFEPRSATACRCLHQAEYVTAFDAADEVLLAPLGRQGIDAAERLDVDRLAFDLAARGKTARACASVAAIVARIAQTARSGDTVALLSNGAFGHIHGKVLDALANQSHK